MRLKKKAGAYHHENLRKALIVAATKVIAKRHEASFSLREIATAIGVSHGAAYRHFQSKRDLLSEIGAEGFSMLEAEYRAVEAQVRASGPPPYGLALLSGMAQAYFRFATENPGYFRAMNHPELEKIPASSTFKQAEFRVFSLLVGFMKTAIEEKLLRDEDLMAMATFGWSLILGVVFMRLNGQIQLLLPHSSKNEAELFEAVLTIGFKGLLHPSLSRE